jgi:hypothetical protein
MKTLIQQNHHIFSLCKSNTERYIIADKDKFIGKLTFMLSDDSIAVFDNKKDKLIFEKVGIQNPIIKISSADDDTVRYTLPFSLRKNASLNILGKVSHISSGQGFLWSIYWEWFIEYTGDSIVSYIQSIDSECPITVKINAPGKIINELNILCAVGCFILLQHEKKTTTLIKGLQNVNQQEGSVEELSVKQLYR